MQSRQHRRALARGYRIYGVINNRRKLNTSKYDPHQGANVKYHTIGGQIVRVKMPYGS